MYHIHRHSAKQKIKKTEVLQRIEQISHLPKPILNRNFNIDGDQLIFARTQQNQSRTTKKSLS